MGVVVVVPSWAYAEHPCVPEPTVPSTSPISNDAAGGPFDRERWLNGVATGLTEPDDAEPEIATAEDPSEEAGLVLGRQLSRGEIVLTPYEWGWLSRAFRTAGMRELGLPEPEEERGPELDPVPDDGTEPPPDDGSESSPDEPSPVSTTGDVVGGKRPDLHPAPSGLSPQNPGECTDIDSDTLDDELARDANDALEDLLNQAARNALNPSNPLGANNPQGDNGGGGGGGPGGGGGYAPGGGDGYASPASARRPLEDLQAEDRCVAALTLMLDGAADMAGGLGLETAEASAALGRTGSLPKTEALLAAAARKIECGRILLGSGTYKLLGRTQEECAALQRDARRRGIDPRKLPTTVALERLPARWEEALLAQDQSGELVKRVIRMLDCKRTGGDCRLGLEWETETVTETGEKKMNVGEMCGGQGNSLIARLLGGKTNDPCRVQDVLDQIAQEQGLPVNLVRSVAWTESNWRQWDAKGNPIQSYSNDYGLMQINKKAWAHKYDFDRIGNDMGYNAQAGGDVLKWSYDYARGRGYRGQALWQATYAVYNGGPRAVNRPWEASRFSQHDRNYLRSLAGKPWLGRTQSCGT